MISNYEAMLLKQEFMLKIVMKISCHPQVKLSICENQDIDFHLIQIKLFEWTLELFKETQYQQTLILWLPS